MKLVVGLGNPGDKYKNTRHNVGFMVVGALLDKIRNSNIPSSQRSIRVGDEIRNNIQIPDLKFQTSKRYESDFLKIGDLVLAKPNTFMNSSGRAAQKLFNNLAIKQFDNLYVVHDDLDLRLGEYKIQKGVGPKLHNGVASIEEKLGSKDFWRVRIGVDNRPSDNRTSGEDYVLMNFSEDEKKVVNNVTEKVIRELLTRLDLNL